LKEEQVASLLDNDDVFA